MRIIPVKMKGKIIFKCLPDEKSRIDQDKKIAEIFAQNLPFLTQSPLSSSAF